MHRVQKLLSNYGYCSRRKAEELIKAGRVRVNDKTITIGDKASEQDKIYVDDKLVNKQKKLYLMFNKPSGCVTALKDKHNKTIMDYIKMRDRVFPIGRLDLHTTGLLLLTNDGDFANKVMHPRYEIKKTYLVRINRPIDNLSIRKIEHGVLLEDGKTSPAKVKKVEDTLLEITIHEGKNRIVRRMMEKLGFYIKYLERIRIGSLELSNLARGRYKILDEKDKEKIFA
ncbi:rRNA pseudouridine synthase [Candidatus Woesearchaeota archaeon]|nr:rRNA pseudouridine synthase [Candidatus Woesearchaeota archaeon]